MSYFLTSEKLTVHTNISISGEEARHILLARRTKIGDSITLQDNSYTQFRCRVIEVKKTTLVVTVEEKLSAPKEPQTTVTLFQALIAETALDIIIQKMTELGCANIVFFQAHFSPHSFSKVAQKIPRWQRIALEAAKQSNRTHAPEIMLVPSLEAAVPKMDQTEICFILDPVKGPKSIPHKSFSSVSFVVGPEGGFSQAEINLLKTLSHHETLYLGPRILRAETAAIAGMSILGYTYSDISTST